jgi:endonuclease/exonuclease/phosphatase family metal-dependent hydrolase
MVRTVTRLRSFGAGCVAILLILMAYTHAAPATDASVPACRELKSPTTTSPPISWITPSDQRDKTRLDQWCRTVGPAIFREGSRSEAPLHGRILVVNWNMHVGNGNIRQLIDRLRRDEQLAGRSAPDFVFLLQEAYRRSSDVPLKSGSSDSVPGRIATSSAGIDDLAASLNWWLFYAPSMRNGNDARDIAEDRGNAILSSLPLNELRAIELPFSVQRRVAVSATVHGAGGPFRFRVAAVHLDTRAPFGRGFVFGAPSARNRQALWLARQFNTAPEDLSLVVGGDLNSYMGPFESSIGTLSRVAARTDCGSAATHASGMMLDHIFARFTPPFAAMPSCRRLDERFESDHYPLVLAVSRSLS